MTEAFDSRFEGAEFGGKDGEHVLSNRLLKANLNDLACRLSLPTSHVMKKFFRLSTLSYQLEQIESQSGLFLKTRSGSQRITVMDPDLGFDTAREMDDSTFDSLPILLKFNDDGRDTYRSMAKSLGISVDELIERQLRLGLKIYGALLEDKAQAYLWEEHEKESIDFRYIHVEDNDEDIPI
ncbi:MAG: hypothetical protein Q7T54_02325 [Candidatus Levybacteria bacterium]|nr:hypothetical protein [Candidatus Levybacteria bacterium]